MIDWLTLAKACVVLGVAAVGFWCVVRLIETCVDADRRGHQ